MRRSFFGAIILAAISLAQAALADTQTRSSSFGYDTSTWLLTQEVLLPGDAAHSVTTTYTYDSFGHRITAKVQAQGVSDRNSSSGYDAAGQFQTSATNTAGQAESWTYDARFGLPLTHIDLNGLTTSWSYDSFGRTTQELRPDGSKTIFTYIICSTGGCSSDVQAMGAFTAASSVSYGSDNSTITVPLTTAYFDVLGRQIATESHGFDGSRILALTQYDEKGNVKKTSRPYFPDNGGTAIWTVNTCDDLGRVTNNTTPNGGYLSATYHGLTITTTNDLGQTKVKTATAHGSPAAVTDAAWHTTNYAYDAFDNLITVTDPNGNVITNGYDVLGHKVASSDPDMGSWSYSYDALGQMVTQTDAKGQVTTIGYDMMGRVVSRAEAGQYGRGPWGPHRPTIMSES